MRLGGVSVSPILVRPVREQLEHDRVIRLLQGRFRRRFDVGMNPGHEQNAPVGLGASATYPDLVLTSLDRGRRLHGIVEVETAESVNHLEAMAQWARLAKLRAKFYLYVPASAVDHARRLCADHHVVAAELVSYQAVGDQLRFTTVYRAPTRPVRARVTARPATRPVRRVAASVKNASAKKKTAKTSRRSPAAAAARAPRRK